MKNLVVKPDVWPVETHNFPFSQVSLTRKPSLPPPTKGLCDKHPKSLLMVVLRSANGSDPIQLNIIKRNNLGAISDSLHLHHTNDFKTNEQIWKTGNDREEGMQDARTHSAWPVISFCSWGLRLLWAPCTCPRGLKKRWPHGFGGRLYRGN